VIWENEMTMIGVDPSEYSKPCHTNLSGAKPANAAILADKDAEIARLLAENEWLKALVEAADACVEMLEACADGYYVVHETEAYKRWEALRREGSHD
jgi:hypothetical protein